MKTAQMPPLPEHDLARIPELVEQMFRGGAAPVAPAPTVKSNLLETWQSYWLQIALPGVDATTLEVQAVGRRVHLDGRFNSQVIETATYLRQELPIGRFEETFELPEEVDGRHAQAHIDGGVLTIRLPKLSYLAPTTIPVQCP